MKSYTASDIRYMNRLTVFRVLSNSKGISKAEIARQTGLSSPTAMKIVDFMKQKDLIVYSGESDFGLGRKSTLFTLNPKKIYSIGIIIEGDYLTVGVVDLLRKIKKRIKVKVTGSFENTVNERLPEIIDLLIKESGISRDKITGIGIGLPGVYNPITYTITYAPLLHINSDVCIKELLVKLEDKFKLPIMIANDTNMEALGEYNSLKLNNKDFIFISLGTGLGAGLIINGKLHVGSRFMSGEIGYMAFEGNYVADVDAPGWLESKINLTALKAKFNFDPANLNQSNFGEVIEYVSGYVALCINNINIFLDCHYISLGGIITETLGERFLEAVYKKVKQFSIVEINIRKNTSIDPGILGICSLIIDDAVKDLLDGG